jgi:predicted aconitase with swiveling domain
VSEIRVLLEGRGVGRALVLAAPLSFWGGVDAERSVLAEAIRLGVGPAGIVLQHSDEIVMLGALAAEILYGVTCPVVVVDAETFGGIVEGRAIAIDGSEVTVG